MMKEAVVEGVKVAVNVYQIGGLGWSWTIYLEGMAEVRNLGSLAPTEDQAFAEALASAKRQIQQTPRA